MQVGFSVVIFVLLASEDGFSREWVVDEQGISRAPSLYNGAFSTIAFLLGAITSIVSGFLGAFTQPKPFDPYPDANPGTLNEPCERERDQCKALYLPAVLLGLYCRSS